MICERNMYIYIRSGRLGVVRCGSGWLGMAGGTGGGLKWVVLRSSEPIESNGQIEGWSAEAVV